MYHGELGHCFLAKDMYVNMLDRDPKFCKKLRKKINERVEVYCGRVLTYCFYLILLDIIENNVTFNLPLMGKRDACLQVKSFEGDLLKRMVQKGKFRGIDLVQSFFKAYQVYYRYKTNSEYREKPIYISYNLKNLFYEKINSGKQYY